VGDDQAVVSPSETAFIEAALQNPFVREILHRAEYLLPDDWYLAAGCLFQTVWNVLDGNDPQHGINDYDLIYFDDNDLFWEGRGPRHPTVRERLRRSRHRHRGPQPSPSPPLVRGPLRYPLPADPIERRCDRPVCRTRLPRRPAPR
jgi:hypothetical protein